VEINDYSVINSSTNKMCRSLSFLYCWIKFRSDVSRISAEFIICQPNSSRISQISWIFG